MRRKIVSADEAVAIIRDSDTLCCSGFGSNGVPVELVLALERRFLDTGAPRNLTLLFGGMRRGHRMYALTQSGKRS
jgi:propionate CoA-transferase